MGICESKTQMPTQNMQNTFDGRNNKNAKLNTQNFGNQENRSNIQSNNNTFNNELEMDTRNKSVQINIINKAIKSVCKIIIKSNPEDIYATGFFMKVSDTKKYLITNNHVISKKNIKDDIEIEIYNQKKMKLNLNNRMIKFFPFPKDITIIEIKKNDEIYNDISFLDYDTNDIRGYENMYQNVPIFTIQHPNGENAEYGCGSLVNIYSFEFDHDISTEKGASGSPIILYTKNINSIQVIGIHKKANYTKNLNSGTFIGEIFSNENDNNYIIAEIEIKDEDVCKDIRIINSFEEHMRENEIPWGIIKE